MMIVKLFWLVCLILQNSLLVVFMNYSRIPKVDGSGMYAASTAVLVMECVKFFTCICVLLFNKRSVSAVTQELYSEIYMKPEEVFNLSIPSLLYVLQNNLLYFALSHLDAATYQVGYNIKILTTAACAYWMLNKHLSLLQQFSLLILTIGVVLVQTSSQNSNAGTGRNSVLGFLAVMGAACLSGYSGVYTEKIIKNGGASVWTRNLQMGITSIAVAGLGVLFTGDLPSVLQLGLCHDYTPIVWAVIALQAVGGLIVSMIMKVADNILKSFAAAISIISSALLCWYLAMPFNLTVRFVVGSALVIGSTFMYSYQSPVPPTAVSVLPHHHSTINSHEG